MTERQRFKFNILFLIYVIMWKMIQTMYLGGFDGAGRISLIMMMSAIFINAKSIFHASKEIWIWTVWVIYVIVCSKIKGFYSDTNTFTNWFPNALLLPLVSMHVACQAVKYDWNKTLKALFYTYVVFVVIGSLNMGISESNADRRTNELGNYFFNNAILLATYSSLLYSLKNIKKLTYFVLLVIILYVIFISGERKGLICVFILIMGSLYALNSNKGSKSLLYMMLLSGVAYLAVDFLINYSVASARMSESMAESSYQDNLFLKLLGDRGIMYYEGWEFFLENKWTGIGITNFRWQNSFFSGLPLHTEYMVQICECGILGSLLFLMFYGNLIKRLINSYKRSVNKTIPIILVSSMIAIIVFNFVSWSYSYAGFFIVFGLILAYCDNQVRNETK